MAKVASKKRAKKAGSAADTAVPVPDARPRIIVSNLPRNADGKVIHKPTEPDLKAASNPRAAILTAFGKLGGVRWLVKLAKRYPKDFAGLLAKAMPQDVNITGTVGYVPLQVPVEAREPIPGTCIDVTPQPVAVELDPFT